MMNLKNLKKNLKKVNFVNKFGNREKKYAFFCALAAFAALNTGFTAQPTSELPAEQPTQVAEIIETTPSDEMKLLIAEESNNLPSRITVSESGSISLAGNDEQKKLLTSIVNNTLANVQSIDEMKGIADGEAIEEPEFIEEYEEANGLANFSNIADINGGRYSSVMSMEATAYLPTDGSAEGLTAMGIPATYGIVAVDPRIIPLGTKVYIPGYGEALAADTGGAIKGYKIDLCMETYEECMNFGRRDITVYVLE